jgi:FHS family Na+ dependent glucose MFS transporter 1
MLPVAVWLMRVPSPQRPRKRTGSESQESAAVQTSESVLIFLLSALFFLCVGAELGFGGWIFSYARAMDLGDPTTSAYLTSVFWGALTFGRLLGIPIAMRLRPRTVLFVDLVGCLLSVILCLAWPDSWTAILVGSAGLGLFMASVFPTIINLAEHRMTITGSITAWFLVGASLGSMSVPWLIGQFFESIGPQAMMAILVVDLAAALAVFAITMLYSARRLSSSDGLVYNNEQAG